MGLDMYLYKKTYVKNWGHTPPEERHSITVKKGGKIRKDIDKNKICEITEQVMYWRKANAIHSWFVEHVQEGADDCKDYLVSKEQLTELRDACATVLAGAQMVKGKIKNGYSASKETNFELKPNMEDGEYIENPTVAKALLPTQEGFFFGSTDYDQYYYEDIKYTKEELDKILAVKSDGKDWDTDYYYSSSW